MQCHTGGKMTRSHHITGQSVLVAGEGEDAAEVSAEMHSGKD
jgi:hypothetical protein